MSPIQTQPGTGSRTGRHERPMGGSTGSNQPRRGWNPEPTSARGLELPNPDGSGTTSVLEPEPPNPTHPNA